MTNKLQITNHKILNKPKGKFWFLELTWNFRRLSLVLVILTAIFYAGEAQASRFYFEAPESEVGVGQEMEVFLRLDSEGEVINALEGEVSLPNTLSLESIREGNSLISLWAERPQVFNNKIVFSGITPGGWQGGSGLVFSFIIKTQSQGLGQIELASHTTLLHDGLGTQDISRAQQLALVVSEDVPLRDLVERQVDFEPPEDFAPILGRDENIFGRKYFLVFVAQDKGLGIARYEVQETRDRLEDERAGEWQEAESPYLIQDQTLKSFIYVRAIDRAGNVRVALIEPIEESFTEKMSKIARQALVPAIVLIVLIGAVVFVRRRRPRK